MPKLFFWLSKCSIVRPLHIALRGSVRKTMFAVAIFSFFFSSVVLANDLSITNAALVDQVTGDDTIDIQFDVTWENSWRDATNYDAVWVFAKYCTENCTTNGTWLHATLSATGTDAGSGTALDVIVSADVKGAFLQRAGNGTGTVTTTGVHLVWDYGANGVSDADAVGANTRVKVFGMEMVYIPQGSFFAGDGSESLAQNPASYAFKQGNTCRDPWPITSEDAITTSAQNPCTTPATYYYTISTSPGDSATGSVFTIGADFPKGYKAFYLMKYELSQGQYRDFLNSLPRGQQNNHTQANVSGDSIPNTFVMGNTTTPFFRNFIRAPASGNGTTNPVVFGCDANVNGVFDESTDGEWVAANLLNWMDHCAYADWAALRPMTELEFEKASRGAGITPVNLEYPWGSTSAPSHSSLTNADGATEVTDTASANANYSSCWPAGPRRCGMFATGSSTRAQAGASYYGVMELAGNVGEQIVTVGNNTGRSFTGTHGDGALSSAGYGNNTDWPGYVTSEISSNIGQGFRGGAWAQGVGSMRVSSRDQAAYYSGYTVRVPTYHYFGSRSVRTAD